MDLRGATGSENDPRARRRRFALASSVLALVLAVPGIALATDLMNDFLWDVFDGMGGNGSIGNGTIDAYDGCYSLTVNSFFYTAPAGTTTSLSGRQIDFPPMDVGSGLSAERHIYVPTTGNWARFVEVVSNTTASDVTTTVEITGNLGSDFGTVLVTTSSGDALLTTSDDWFATDDVDGSGDPSLAHVVQGVDAPARTATLTLTEDNLEYLWDVTVPAGGIVAIMHFAVQAPNQATAEATATMLHGTPDEALVGLDAWSGDIANWSLAYGGTCTGGDGTACTSTSGAPGSCQVGRCCTGCWDGARCHTGRSTSSCGVSGGACIRCADIAFCSSALCTAGVCNGSPCDDGQSCTTDTCDEAANTCSHAVTSGCIIGGECVGDGVHHIAYPCLVCDSALNGSDWSVEPAGTTCGAARCSAGLVFTAGTCDDIGSCVTPTPTECRSMTCASDGVTCEPPCTSTSCPAGYRCGPAMHCVAVAGLGASCTSNEECIADVCADGVCCDHACDGVCESCDLPGREGTCRLIGAGMDPASECGAGRACDGHGMCMSLDSGIHPHDAGPRDAGDARVGADADAGATTTPPAQSCGCTVPGVRGGGAWAWALGLLALGVSRRRRAW